MGGVTGMDGIIGMDGITGMDGIVGGMDWITGGISGVTEVVVLGWMGSLDDGWGHWDGWHHWMTDGIIGMDGITEWWVGSLGSLGGWEH